MIVVRRPGALTTVQDRGRPGHAHLGVPRAGAVDLAALDRANRLVGNRLDAAALEVTALGPDLEFETDALVAVHDRVRLVPAGELLRVGAVRPGLRTYLAVRGGIDVRPVLGSRSSCTLSGLGPAPLRAGDRLSVGTAVTGEPQHVAVPAHVAEPVLRVLAGPRDDAFPPGALDQLAATTWTVSTRSDRTGIRLEGPPLPAGADGGRLPSEGMVAGAVQVPPDGAPVLFLANHPVTGGYPVLAVVVDADLTHAAQARPGSTLRFRVERADERRPQTGQPAPG